VHSPAAPDAAARCRALPDMPNAARPDGRAAFGPCRLDVTAERDQLKLSPHAQELPALGLSMVKPCFSMVSEKSIVAPSR